MSESFTVRIRPELPADYAATEALAHAAFAPDERVAELIRRLRRSEAIIPDLNLVAEVDGTLVGHLMFSRARIASGHSLALLSPLGVLPEYQRRGVGSSLIYRALHWLSSSSFPAVVLEGVPAYYPRFGFSSAYALGIDPPFPVPAGAWQAYRLPTYDETVQGQITYPQAFDFLHSEE